VLPSGGSSGYAIGWTDGNADFYRSNLCTGSYDFTLIDNRNSVCKVSGTVTVDHFPDISIVLDEAIAPTCPGGNDGYLSITVRGGSGNYDLLWSNGVANNTQLDGFQPGNYMLTVNDEVLGCQEVDSFEIPDATAITVESTELTAPLCHGGKDGKARLILSNVNSPMVRWENGQIGLSATGLTTGLHGYSIKGSTGCIVAGNVDIPDRDILVVDAVTSPTTCDGVCDGTIALTNSGGTAPYLVAWSHGPRITKVENLCEGLYSYKVTDRNGCKVSSSASVTSPEPIDIVLTKKDPTCYGYSDGELSAQVTGGTSPYTYAWNNDSTDAALTGLTDDVYSLEIHDANRCVMTKTETLTQPAGLQLLDIVTLNPSCPGSADGKVSFVASGGTPAYVIAWDDGGLTQARDHLGAGKYTVMLSDSKKCTTAQSFDLVDPSLLEIVDIKLSDPKCFNETNGEISLNVIGGALPYTYKWSDGNTTRDIKAHKAGDYKLAVTDKKGCVVLQSFTLANPPVPEISGVPESIIICTNSVAAAEPEGNWSKYLWTGPKSFEQTIRRFETKEGGKYKLTAWNINGCPGEKSFTVEVSPNALVADFLRISEAIAFEPIVFVDISIPKPQLIEWKIPDSPDVSVSSDVNGVLELIFTAAGNYEIGMKASMDNCISELYKTIEVAEASAGRTNTTTTAAMADPEELEIVVYPNPASDHLEIRIHSSSEDPIDLRMIKSIENRPIMGEKVEGYLDYLVNWDVPDATAGIYFLVYEQHGTIRSKRIVIIR
jgi:hypothetical protein